jgi:hypothetical protein
MQAVASMAQFEMRLATGNEQQRAQAFWELASAYGVTEDALVATRPGEAQAMRQQYAPQQPPHDPRLDALLQHLQAQAQQRQQQTEQQFAASHEFYSDVRGMMQGIKTANPGMSDEDAYNAACYAHPEVRSVLEQRSAAKRAEEERAKVQRHLAAGSSLPNKPSSSGGNAGKGSAFLEDISRILDGG